MTDAAAWPWLVLLLLGAAHGLNPGMGWLFAVALGAQQGDRRGVWRALLPLGAGHALAVAAAIALAAAAGLVVPVARLRWIVAALLLAVGVVHWTRHLHPRWGGMRVGARELTAWSFLMATAHGAGLMALPFAMDAGAVRDAAGAGAGGHASHAAHAAATGVPGASGAEATALLATAVHAAGYLLVAGLVAVVVYERAGLRFLRRAWVNVDRLWAGALVVTAVAIVVA